MFGLNKVEFRERQVNAIRRALAATRLSYKEIAYALGVDGDTFAAWARGEGNLHGAAIDALDNLFCSHGYYAFINDIYGQVFARRRERALKLQQEADRMRATADIMEAVA
jgi:transcriptional regulator with XRE-family HTH domain